MAGLREEERERAKGRRGERQGPEVRRQDGTMGREREEPVGTEVRMEGPWSKKQERRTEQGAPRGPEVVLLSEACCSQNNHRLRSHCEHVHYALRNGKCTFVFQPWNINFEVQIYFLQEVRRLVHLRKNREFSPDLGAGSYYTNYGQKIPLTLKSCQRACSYSLREEV